MSKLSVILITYNEEKNIERCLNSVSWADEIIVVDSFSTDATISLTKKFTSYIIQHKYDGDINQRERGFAAAKGDWLFYIDADEEVNDELREDILNVMRNGAATDGYYAQRRNKIFGRWMYNGGWFPDLTFRLFNKEKYLAEHEEVHGGFTVRGAKGTLNGFLNHYPYETIEQYLAKMNDYTSLQVSNKLKQPDGVNISWIKIIFSPLSHFIRKFISNKGYKDGLHGFVLAMLGAIYTFSLYAKCKEYEIRLREEKGILPPITNLELLIYKRPGFKE
ncbi:MAG: glycosyltransferase family 2 protein [Bacteroidetes bacterium]|nr:MAG: glycosyltransferase family 2 protein [Bacteroidota bacterium]